MFSQEIADAICERVASGASVRSACAEQGVAHSSFLRWVSNDKALADQYARALDIGADVGFDSLEELADETPERDDRGKVDPGWVAYQKMRIDTRKWTLARKAPKKYGDKVEQTLNGSLDVNNKIERITRKIVDAK